jgi:peptide/nickel transport system ATP-binding protein
MVPLIELCHATKTYGHLVALEDFSLAIDGTRPTITAIVGESGSGKTTLARLLLGLVAPTSGEVLYQGRNLHALSAAERRAFRRDIQAIFQDPYGVYNPFYRVDHVLRTPVARFHLAKTTREAHGMIEDALRAVGLRPEEILGRYPHQLSGGQRQRVMVARALLLRPHLIVADEPVSMVDASLRATILGSLRELNLERGISIIYITHDLATAYQVADNIIVLYRASVTEAGDVELVVKAPKHPYTRLLIASIPQVSVQRTWLDEPAGGQRTDAAHGGCKFVARCPVAMRICQQTAPVPRETEPGRIVACHQYADA